FTPFVYYVMCISPNTPPLGVISFWYVIGFYPLLLLLLLYVWITLYDKGYKCVVFITRPFHRCMARFWSMTGIEPSFTHSIASIYILCFTQLAATSFKILSINLNSVSTLKFYYDMKQDYFDVKHGAVGFFAILVLLFLIVLPTLYILLYPFKWFHKLLDCLHLRKQLLISLGDVFTGPYKNGTENTYDYRFMAGLYLLMRIITTSYIIYQVYKMIKSCCRYHKRNNPVANRNQEEDHQPLVGNDDDWIADRMENPQEYDEQHVPGRIYEYDRQPQQQKPNEPITIATAATYGSC
uniref:Uncharacterized protein n=1 Tax=Amphimedon queenslandica TaxID=400682 RepID=A0A1X7UV06_AMPQE